ncbi:MAG: hypothetical protein L3J71_11500 [Victivallaceae bacterium]|nr:hypothetical protein [Victivallaceae bacterium]
MKKIILWGMLAVFHLAALNTLARAETKQNVLENSAIVLRGIAYEYYRLPELLKALRVKNSKIYTITNNAPALTPVNKFRLDRLPRIYPPKAPKYIIMADFPLNKGVMPKIVLKSLIRDVKRGSTLVILGGLFTLNKGEFNATPLASLLPVKVTDCWAVKHLKSPLKTLGGSVAYRHNIPLTIGAETLFAVNEQPLWVSKKYGVGKIIVFLGIPSGHSTASAVLFWEDPRWPSFAAKYIR